jgi:hypothetical protein
MRLLPLLMAACVATGCASGPVVQADSDPAVDFSRYRTYAWKQPPPIGNPLLKQRVVSAVDAELSGKGWRLAPETDADVVLVGNVAARDETSLSYFYDDSVWYGWNWNPRGPRGVERVELRTFRLGTLVVDMFDADTRQAVWRGVAQGTVPESEARRTRDAIKAVHEMFRGFPPPPAPSP